LFCYKCGKEINTNDRIGRQQQCPECGAFLHCCLNCEFYYPNAYHQCRESEAEFVSDKKSGNFCSYFKPSSKKNIVDDKRAEEARKKLDELFKNKKN